MRHIQLLQAHHPPNLLRQRPHQLIKADVEHRQILQQPDLLRHARPQPVVRQNNLIQPRHVPQAGGHAPAEIVVGEDDDRHGGVAEVGGNVEVEAVAVDEYGVEVFVEELGGDGAFELVESEVEVSEGREAEDDGGELAGESVVADVELEEEMQVAETVRDGAAEAVGVDVEEGEVAEEGELFGEVAGDVAVVEVDSGDDRGVRI